MKNFILLLMFLISFGCSSDKVDLTKANSEAKAFIESQFDFFTSSSIEKAKTTFSNDAILIGTDKSEYLKGWSEIEPSIVGQLAIEDPKFSTRDLNIVMSSSGDMASYTQLLDFSFNVNGENGEIKDVRNSGVIKKTNGAWEIVQIHWSIGVEGQAVEYEY